MTFVPDYDAIATTRTMLEELAENLSDAASLATSTVAVSDLTRASVACADASDALFNVANVASSYLGDERAQEVIDAWLAAA